MVKTLTIPTEEERNQALDSFFAVFRESQAAKLKAQTELFINRPILIDAIRSGTGQGQRVERIIRSVWNGCHQVGLCDDLCGLDHKVSVAVLSLIAARTFMGGDADDLIRDILIASGAFDRLLSEEAA